MSRSKLVQVSRRLSGLEGCSARPPHPLPAQAGIASCEPAPSQGSLPLFMPPLLRAQAPLAVAPQYYSLPPLCGLHTSRDLLQDATSALHTTRHVSQAATSPPMPDRSADRSASNRIHCLLQHYRRNLGAVGTAISQISHHLLHGPPPTADDAAEPDLAALNQATPVPTPLHDASLQVLADTMSGFVSAGSRPSDLYLKTAAARFQQVLAAEFDDRAVAKFLEALALFGFQPSPCQVDAAAAAIGCNLQASSPGSISKMLAALAVFGHTQRALLGRVADAVVERVTEFQPMALVDIVYAYAMLGNRSERLINAVLQEVMMDLGHLPRASLTQIVCALAMLDHKDVVADVFLSAASDEILKAIGDFSGHQLSEILWAYTQMEQWGRADSDLMEAIIYKMLTLHQDLDGKDLVNLVRALAVSQHQSPRTADLLDAVVQDVLVWVPQLNAERLSRLLWGLASLRYYHAPLYNAVAQESAARLDSFRPDHLTSLLLAWATTVHDPHNAVLDPLLARLGAQVPGMRARSICAMLWSLAVLRRLSPALFTAACSQLDRRPLTCFEHLDFERLQSAQMLLAAEVGPGAPTLPEWIKGYAESAWKDKAAIEQLPSSCHIEVRNFLRDVGTLSRPMPCGNARPTPDFVFTDPGGRQLALRVVMPLSMTVNKPYRELAHSAVTTRLLEAAGWNVLQVEKRKWTAQGNAAAKTGYLQQLLDEKLHERTAA